MNMKKLIKWFWITAGGLVALLIASGILAFLIKDEKINRYSLWGSWFFGFGTILLSFSALMVSVIAYMNTVNEKQKEISNKAEQFIIEHDKEMVYLPLCIISNLYNKHHKYNRTIYTDFNKCSKDVQLKILEIQNYSDVKLLKDGWISQSIELVNKYIDDNELGDSPTKNGAKYFHKAIEYSNEKYSILEENSHIFEDLYHLNKKYYFSNDGQNAYVEKITFDDLLESYIEKRNANDILYLKYKEDFKPIDYLMAYCQEKDECSFVYWNMHIVYIIALLSQREMGCDGFELPLSRGDAIIETFEDRYLEVLLELYNVVVLKNKK